MRFFLVPKLRSLRQRRVMLVHSDHGEHGCLRLDIDLLRQSGLYEQCRLSHRSGLWNQILLPRRRRHLHQARKRLPQQDYGDEDV